MANGGMIQILKEDGAWSDCFPVSDKPNTAAMNMLPSTAPRLAS